ncbi:MAG: GNAT family N-acetyltransferase [Gammaproteobacteria bacterium]
MLVRDEEQQDWVAVHAVNASAFETPAEANLVVALREQARPIVSLVAVEAETVVGHIMFSPVSLSGHPDLNIMGLAPNYGPRSYGCYAGVSTQGNRLGPCTCWPCGANS